jgi:hypothetical protein
MAQKKAFVRYAQNKAVPGSLIVRTKAPKVGTWKEVPYNLCCGGGSSCSYTRNIDNVTYPATTGILFQLAGGPCGGGLTEFNYTNIMIDDIPEINNINDLVQMLNENLSFYGTFSVTGPTDVTLKLSSYFSFVCSCDQIGDPFFYIGNN